MCARTRARICARLCTPPPPLTHTHTGTGTRTHKHSDYTNLNLNSIKRAANRDLILMKTERERERSRVHTFPLHLFRHTKHLHQSQRAKHEKGEKCSPSGDGCKTSELPAKFLTQKVNTVVRSPTKQTAWVSMWTLQVTVYLHSPSSHSHN